MSKSNAGWAYTGDEISRKAKEVESKKSGGSKRDPFRFFLKKGEECEIILLDNRMEDGIAFYEHNTKGADGRWGHHVPCIKDFAECPVCKHHGDSSYVLFLSCLVLKPFTTKAGKEIPHSKMLLPIKITQFDLFRQLQESAVDEGGSLRGMSLLMKRGTDTTAPRIGEPIPVKGRLYDLLDEDELEEDFGHPEIKNDDGEVFRVQNYDITSYDYYELFPKPDVKAIMEEYGGSPVAGSYHDIMDEMEKEEPKQEATSRRRTRRKSGETAPF